MNFTLYKLNGNYTTEDGVNLIDPDFRIQQFFYCDVEQVSEIVIHWKDENNDFLRAFNTPFSMQEFPTVESLQNQLLQVPEFSNSTIVTP